MVTQINATTKKAQYYIKRYKESLDFTLDHVYRTYSEKKRYAYNAIKNRADVDATTLKILGANCDTFTVGYFLADEPNTLAIQTASNIFLIPLTAEQAYLIK